MQGYLVGGRVRCLFTNESISNNADYDVVVVGTTYKKLLQYFIDNNVDIKLPENQYIPHILNDEFDFDTFFTKDNSNWTAFKTGVIKVILKGTKCSTDYVLARKNEEYENNNLVPTGIIINDQVTLDEDLLRRDFCLNAMTLPLHNLLDITSYNIDELYDPCNGLLDIQNKRITCVGSPYKRFIEDPSRILRLFKFMLRLNYSCCPSIKSCLDENSIQLTQVFKSKMNTDRIIQELKYIFNNNNSSYKSINMFMSIIPSDLAQVILNDCIFLNPTKFNK